MEFLAKREEMMRTVSCAYPCDELDLDNEYASAEELRHALERWQADGDSRIYFQHSPGHFVGEIVKMWQIDEPLTTPVYDGRGAFRGSKTFKKGSLMTEIQWSQDAWRLIKEGRARGLSIGGRAGRRRGQVMKASETAAQPELRERFALPTRLMSGGF